MKGKRSAPPTALAKTKSRLTSPATRGYGSDFCRLVSECAARFPKNTAISDANHALTYHQMQLQVDAVALRLQTIGVGEGAIVGVYLERNVSMLVALLGIMRAGAAYLPLETDLPESRLDFLLKDASCGHVIVNRHEDFRRWGAETLEVSKLTKQIQPSVEPVWPNPNRIAYVIYTSGSSGFPKGVQVGHGALCNHLQGIADVIGTESKDVWLSTNSIAFDASVTQIFLPFVVGGEVAIASHEEMTDGNLLAGALERHAATYMDLTPSGLQLLTAMPEWRSPDLIVTTGGETLPPALAKDLKTRVSRFWNMYGPTEATVIATCYEVTGEESNDIPIGIPAPNYEIVLVDDSLKIVETGREGEICIGGPGLSQGYRGKPDLTAERFVEIVTPDGRPQIFYRSGDFGRIDEAGQLRFLGRRDFQIKIRGFRIELEEIENQLRQLPGIREVAVIVEGEGEQAALHAFFNFEPTTTWTSRGLRSRAAERLPIYMVPTRATPIDVFPLNQSGKVDRNALHRLAVTNAKRESLAADNNWHTGTEERLAKIWREIMPNAAISRDRNLLDAGAHSILIMKAVARIINAFGVQLSVRSVFESPSIRHLAELIDSTAATKTAAYPKLTIHKQSTVELSFMQKRLWMMSQFDGANETLNVPVLTELRGSFRPDLYRLALRHVVAANQCMRARFTLEKGVIVQHFEPINAIELPIVEIDYRHLRREDAEAKAQRCIDDFCNQSILPSEAPCFRVLLSQMSDEKWYVTLVLHHLVTDGWSTSVLLSEITNAYQQLENDSELVAETKTPDVADFVRWQQALFSDAALLQKKESYWRAALRGANKLVELPADHLRPSNRNFDGATIRYPLSDETFELISQARRNANASIFMVLLAGLNALLYRFTGKNSITIGVPVSERRVAELEHVLGCMMNTLPIHTRFHAEMTFGELLTSVRDTTLGAFDNQDYPLDALDAKSTHKADDPGVPMMQVILAYQQFGEPRLIDLPNLKQNQLSLYHSGAQSELVFYGEDDEEGIVLELEYSSSLFNESTAESICDQLETVLKLGLQSPTVPISELDYLEEAYQSIVFDEAFEHPTFTPIHNVIDRTAADKPNRIWCNDDSGSWTAAQLVSRANQLANWLALNGYGQGSKVGLMLPRDRLMLISLLGVLKSGAAFVPIDVDWPTRRQRRICESAGVEILISAETLEPENLGDFPNVYLDRTDVKTAIEEQPTCSPSHVPGPEDHAYTLFTSGSTGTPHGVMVSHEALSCFITAITQRLQLKPSDI